jgi:glycosyltransferase involved in cell wall biosynthesis
MKQDISVILPYYNEAETIVTTLDLLSRQTCRPREVIFVDSGSTDRSYDIIQEWIKDNQERLQGVEYTNLKAGTKVPSSSRNAGVIAAKGEFIAFMDCGLIFSADWLEKQVNYLHSGNFDVVSGGCLLEGVNLLDRSAAAQTYGYKRFRPCIPSSLIKKSVFDRIGPFLDGRRAGYDVDWVKRLGTMRVARGINRDVIVRYNGINYAESLKKLFLKSMQYAEGTVGVHKYYYPYIYILLVLAFLLVLFLQPFVALVLLSVYFIGRGYCVPFFKTRGFTMMLDRPLLLLTLPVVGFIIDLGKLAGVLKGLLGGRLFQRICSCPWAW